MQVLYKIVGVLFVGMLTLSATIVVALSDVDQDEVIYRYNNAILIGPPSVIDGNPTVKLVDRVDVYKGYIRSYNYDGSEVTYPLGPWEVYTSALTTILKECPEGSVLGYVIPKGDNLSRYKNLVDAGMCITHIDNKWIASKEYFDITNGDRINFSESFNPDAVEIYAADFNGIYSIKDGEIELELN